MMLLMKTLRDLVTCVVALTIFSACALAFPTSFNSNDGNGDLETLLEELRKELHLKDKHDAFSTNDISFPSSQLEGTQQFGTFGQFQPDQDLQQNQLFAEDSSNFKEVKRQGSWSYDYGLGGGRFGKRAEKLPERVRRPADYFALGGFGGRFGRDTDRALELADEFEAVPDYDETSD